MGSTRLPPPELVPLLAELEKEDRERAEKAIRSVRENLTTRFRVEDDLGVLEVVRPRTIARILAGKIFDYPDIFELMPACPHLMELASKVQAFYNAFVAERAKAKRGKKRYVPDEETLRANFGEDWALVQDAWPAVAFLVKVLELREDPSLPLEEKNEREEAYWGEAELYLVCRCPNEVVRDDVIRFVKRNISTMKLKSDDPDELVQAVLEHAFADAEGLRKRILAYDPRGSEQQFFRYWLRSLRNAARDRRPLRTTLGRKGEDEISRAPSTLRRWKHEAKRQAQPESPSPGKSLVNVADEKDARRQHRDPTGTYLTLTEVAEKLRVPESSVRNAVKRACAAGALVPQRQPNSLSYAFRPGVDEKIIARFLGARRAPRGGRTIEAAAREAGVPLEQAISLILAIEEELGWEAERAISAGKVIPRDQYEALVQMLRDGCDVAATGGCAKPRTS